MNICIRVSSGSRLMGGVPGGFPKLFELRWRMGSSGPVPELDVLGDEFGLAGESYTYNPFR